MKRILASLALCLCASNLTYGADNAHLYNEHYAIKENAGKNFTPLLRNEPGHEDMRANYTTLSKQNHQVFKRGGYTTLSGTHVTKDQLGIAESMKGSEKRAEANLPRANDPKNNPHNKKRLNKITIKEQDTFEAAIEIITNSNFKARVAALNFANKDTQGGGYLHGSNAQEEDLCRRSTLYPILDNHAKNKGDYPIAHDQLIYTPKVHITRNSYKNDFKFLDKPYICDVITQAAYNVKAGEVRPDDYDDFNMKSMINKIRYQFRAAATKGCGSIVVGAFGCGAFRNDPNVVADLYLKVLQEDEFKNVFNEVRFAILGKQNLNTFLAKLSALPNLEVL